MLVAAVTAAVAACHLLPPSAVPTCCRLSFHLPRLLVSDKRGVGAWKLEWRESQYSRGCWGV